MLRRLVLLGVVLLTSLTTSFAQDSAPNGAPAVQCIPCQFTIYCEYGFKTDENGCETCECRRNPVDCDPFVCSKTCINGYKRDPESGCRLCECELVEPCPSFECDVDCDHGFKTDANGCNVCECKWYENDPCPPEMCSSCFGNEDKVDENYCYICVCESMVGPSCPPSSLQSCRNRCNINYRVDDNGCPICDSLEMRTCNLTCEFGLSTDPAGCEYCECRRNPLDCDHHSADYHCPMRCEHGFERDSNSGCEICECKQPPQSQPTCEPVRCRMYCEHGWAKDETTGCDICSCADPPVPSTCEPVLCRMYCEHGWAKDETTGCDICRCADPPTPFQPAGCTSVRCLRSCEFGFKTDTRGCSTCQCKESENDPCPADLCEKCLGDLKTDANGCSICVCESMVDPSCPESALQSCRSWCNLEYRLDESGCPVCESTAMRNCNLTCEFGYEYDSDVACEVCQCKRNPRSCRYSSADDHCGMRCEHGFKRDLKSGCEICQCKEPCPNFQCYRFCEFGFKTDENGCNIYKCECNACPPFDPVSSCETYCFHGYKKDQNGCNTCECECSELHCNLDCEFGQATDSEGCEICRCNPGPAGCPVLDCPGPSCRRYLDKGTGCETCDCLSDTSCDPWCPNMPRCEHGRKHHSAGGCLWWMCECAEACPATRPVCPGLGDCPNGRKINESGCEICECAEAPCTAQPCKEYCVHGYLMDDLGCQSCWCRQPNPPAPTALTAIQPAPQGLFCPPFEVPFSGCSNFCSYGFKYDANGCTNCECDCADRHCNLDCEFGQATDSNGCEICRCNPGPAGCPVLDCPGPPCRRHVDEGTGCETCGCLSERSCDPWCDNWPRCYEYGYKYYADGGCRWAMCECTEACPATRPVCPGLGDCPNGRKIDESGCEICECAEDPCRPQPCKEYCVRGYEMDALGCKTCRCKQPYIPAPTTAPTAIQPAPRGLFCPPFEVPFRSCSNSCNYGRQYDENGCTNCECVCMEDDCNLDCEFGLVTTHDGCEICQCNPGPAGCPVLDCPGPPCSRHVDPGTGCQTCTCEVPLVCELDPGCMGLICKHGRKIAGFHGHYCDECECAEACPETRPVCPGLGDCPNGRKIDENGCEICKCAEPPCRAQPCKEYCRHGYKNDVFGCQTCSCKPTPVECPPICDMYCEYGYQRDDNDCEICECNPRPSRCYGLLECNKRCEFGLALDFNGCEVCACAERAKPTQPSGWCRPVSYCQMECPYGFVRDPSTGCEICVCLPPPPSEGPSPPRNGGGGVCNPVMCDLRCYFGWDRDPTTGCEICRCAENPNLLEWCEWHSCLYMPQCPYGIKRNLDGCHSCECAERAVCPSLTCGRIGCRHGYERDHNGCELCYCATSPLCPAIDCMEDCPHGNEWDSNGCETCICKPSPEPLCPAIECTEYCPHGNERDRHGCETCICKQNPEPCPPVLCRMACPHGWARDVVTGCDICECAPPPPLGYGTVPSCPSLSSCYMGCRYGRQQDGNGCDVCSCNPPPEGTVDQNKCPKEQCMIMCKNGFRVDSDGCELCECVDQGQVQCPQVMCMIHCEHGFKSDADGCRTCSCKPASTVTRTLANRCPMMSCPKMCMFGFREDPQGCTTCQCKDSACEGVTCPDGQVCYETPLQCLVAPCPVRTTCQDLADVESAPMCRGPPEAGMCRAAMKRFYFNTQTQSCESFIYGGCGGNGNNYMSESECMLNCKDHERMCTGPAETGRCRAAMRRFHFNPETRKCESFIYGGCGGNGNNYMSESECMLQCSESSAPSGPMEVAMAFHHNVENLWTGDVMTDLRSTLNMCYKNENETYLENVKISEENEGTFTVQFTVDEKNSDPQTLRAFAHRLRNRLCDFGYNMLPDPTSLALTHMDGQKKEGDLKDGEKKEKDDDDDDDDNDDDEWTVPIIVILIVLIVVGVIAFTALCFSMVSIDQNFFAAAAVLQQQFSQVRRIIIIS